MLLRKNSSADYLALVHITLDNPESALSTVFVGSIPLLDTVKLSFKGAHQFWKEMLPLF